MMGGMRASLLAAAALAALAVATAARADDVLVSEGREVYERYCAGCHGMQGDGHGPAAEMLLVKPRDFTKGVFKFRSTPAGTLPTDDDLMRTITRGLARTSMPEWSLLPERERRALVAYVKTFVPDWSARGAGAVVVVPPLPAAVGTPASIARGKEVYGLLECATCHGDTGMGDGPSARALPPDTWGNPQKPFNFTKGRLKSGADPQDVYRTFMTGLNGTAMPSYGDIFASPDGESIKDGDAWALVSFVLSLRKEPR
jgi:cytochrome c oxidase cbb3-type subunit I/II